MPDLDVGSGFGFGSDAARVGAAILFLQASTNAMDVFSAVNSSPWTAENFGGDQTKNASVREYVWHGIGLTVFYIGGASVLARSWWPVIGGGITLVYMWWLYHRALERGAARQSQGWSSQTPPRAAQAANANGDGTPMPWSA
jgi:hypothetical protein